jgi:hypothetical protein
MVSQLFDVLLRRKSKIKFLLASMKSHTICENPARNPHQGTCSGFLIAACDSKVVPKAACDPENCSKVGYECIH